MLGIDGRWDQSRLGLGIISPSLIVLGSGSPLSKAATPKAPAAGNRAAMRDALRLSRGMSYKNAMAGLPMGGGKAVILADEDRRKTPDLFAAFGDAVDSLIDACGFASAPCVNRASGTDTDR